jgi:hypothetical protein
VLGLALAAGPAASAQRATISGQVLYGTARRPLPRTWVILHRVQRSGPSGPVDSTRTSTDGRYNFTLARTDSNAVYVTSSWYDGIAYFSAPEQVSGRPELALQPINVYDTTTTGPAVRVEHRLITVARPKEDGTRAVLEILALENPGTATKVAADSSHPNWAGVIPHEGIQFEVGQGDVSAEAVGLVGDSILVFGPIPPGGPKQLSFSYVLPATTQRLAVPIDQSVGQLLLLLEDTTTGVVAPGLEALGVEEIDSRRFASYRALDVVRGADVVITFPARGFRVQSLIPYVVAVLALMLILGLVVALKRARLAPGQAPS